MQHTFFHNFSVYDNQLSGNPIVFLHGLGGNATQGDFLNDVFPNRRILIPELPGHGHSKSLDNETDIYEIALKLEPLLGHYNIEMPIIVGHSLGGQIAILHEIINPGRCRSLQLIAPAGLELFTDLQKPWILSGLQMGSYFQEVMDNMGLGKAMAPNGQSPEIRTIQAYTKSMMDRPVKELLDRIHCPVNIFFGENDPLIPNKLYTLEAPVSFAKSSVKGLSNYTVTGIPNAGHWPMLENRAGLVKAMRELAV